MPTFWKKNCRSGKFWWNLGVIGSMNFFFHTLYVKLNNIKARLHMLYLASNKLMFAKSRSVVCLFIGQIICHSLSFISYWSGESGWEGPPIVGSNWPLVRWKSAGYVTGGHWSCLLGTHLGTVSQGAQVGLVVQDEGTDQQSWKGRIVGSLR